MQSVLAQFAAHPLVGDVRGVGLLTGMELMADKATRTPFAPERGIGRIVDKHARAHGLITRFIGDRIAFSPPLIVTEADLDEIAKRLQAALDDAHTEIRAQ